MKYLDKLHILYTDKDGKFQDEEKDFPSIADAEKWLESINAQYWEIGFLDLGADRLPTSSK